MKGVAAWVLVAAVCALAQAEDNKSGEPTMSPSELLASLQGGPMQYIAAHPIRNHLILAPPKDGEQAGRPSAPSMPLPPAAPAAPAAPASNPQGVSLLPNLQPMDHSMMMPLLSMPAILDNPSRLMSGLAMAPLWDSTEKGMAARNSVFGGMNPRERDEIIHQNLLSFVMARQLATSFGTQFLGADPRNNVFDWFNNRVMGRD